MRILTELQNRCKKDLEHKTWKMRLLDAAIVLIGITLLEKGDKLPLFRVSMLFLAVDFWYYLKTNPDKIDKTVAYLSTITWFIFVLCLHAYNLYK